MSLSTGRNGRDLFGRSWQAAEGRAKMKTPARPLGQLTLLSHVLVQHQLAMPEEVQDGSKVGGVTVNEVGPSLILRR